VAIYKFLSISRVFIGVITKETTVYNKQKGKKDE